MKTTLKGIPGGLVFLLLAMTSGCGPTMSQVAPPASELLVTVTDRTGATRTFRQPPQRIVSLSPATTELMFAIGAGDTLVGATSNCNYPPAALAVPRVGNGIMEGISRETILSLDPDLVICKWDSHEPLMALFDRLDIPCIAVGPESLEQLFTEAKMLGQVTGHEEGAEQLVQAMSSRHGQLAARVEQVAMTDRPTVFYEVWDDPLMTAGPDSFIGELLTLAGAKNIFSDTTKRFPSVSSEVVVDRNPDVILAPSDHSEQVTWERMVSRPGWGEIDAIENHKVFLIDGDKISRCGPRMLDALEQIIDALHGDPH